MEKNFTVKTLDLNIEFEKIREQLLQIADEFTADSAGSMHA